MAGNARPNAATTAARDVLDLRLGGGPESAAIARRHIARLRGDIDPPLMETMRLLVTELVANSVRHTSSASVVLKVVVGRGAVLVEVADEGEGFDPASNPGPQHEHGWGLFLVERLANRWGVSRDDSATRVWFELLRV